MKNLILKITEGELFRFYDTEERESVVIGSSRKADICIRSVYIQPQQLRLTRENGVWFAEELGGKDPKCVALLGGKPFRRPKVRLDGELALRRTDAEKKEKDGELCRITPVRQINRRKAGPAFDLTQKTVTTFRQRRLRRAHRQPACLGVTLLHRVRRSGLLHRGRATACTAPM